MTLTRTRPRLSASASASTPAPVIAGQASARPFLDTLPTSPIGRRGGMGIAAVTLCALVLGGCASPQSMDGTILSRLPAGAPGSPPPAPQFTTTGPGVVVTPIAPVGPSPALSDPAEQLKRYNQIDQQALQDQERAIQAEDALRQAQAMAPPVTSVYYGGYGGWAPYGGWYGPAWGYSPGWYGSSWGGGYYGGRYGRHGRGRTSVYINGVW